MTSAGIADGVATQQFNLPIGLIESQRQEDDRFYSHSPTVANATSA